MHAHTAFVEKQKSHPRHKMHTMTMMSTTSSQQEKEEVSIWIAVFQGGWGGGVKLNGRGGRDRLRKLKKGLDCCGLMS